MSGHLIYYTLVLSPSNPLERIFRNILVKDVDMFYYVGFIDKRWSALNRCYKLNKSPMFNVLPINVE